VSGHEENEMKLGKPEVKPVLMQVLYNLTNGVDSVAMRDEVKVETFNLLGIDPDSLGKVTKGAKAGTAIADKLLNACFSELKKDGLTHSPLRNRYALTSSGLSWITAHLNSTTTTTTPVAPAQVAQLPVTQPPVTPAVQVDQDAPAPVEVAPAKPVQKEVATQTQSTPRKVRVNRTVAAPVAPEVDPYILSLMVTSSPCFGVSPSKRAKTCKGCPVFSACVTQRNSRIRELAVSLEAQAARLEVVDIDAMVEVPAAEEPVVFPADWEAVPIEVDGVMCEHCHGIIAVGSEGVIVKDLGMFHADCAHKAAEAASAKEQRVAAAGGA